MAFGNVFFNASSSSSSSMSAQVTDPLVLSDKASESSSSTSDNSTQIDSTFSPHPSTNLSLLTPATSTEIDTSYQSVYLSPPIVKARYDPAHALVDIFPIGYALDLFLKGKMLESENFCDVNDPQKERLYFTSGFGLIQCLKGLMSYEDEDLLAGITHTKHGNYTANQHRKKQAFLGSTLAGYVVSSLHSSGVGFIKSMTDVERHAELMYAETLYEKALLGIVYSGDWLAFIKEALNMRTTLTIYRQLGQYLDDMDAEAEANGLGPIDTSIDEHFRSGVYLGVGMCNIILSMIPGKLATLVELFGYKGDRKLGLEMLMKAGGWFEGEEEPRVTVATEGLRRSICDLCLLMFHLFFSNFTFEGIDIRIASKILDWNLKRYPTSVFFLFGAGRLAVCHSQPHKAIEYYTKAMESQAQYRNLHHVSFWEIAVAHLSLWKVDESLKFWRQLVAESTWSKAIYTYSAAACLIQLSVNDESMAVEASALMPKVPGLRQKIAGKSIPMEKLVARKARKYEMQGNRLALPGLELTYLLHGIANASRSVIKEKMMPEIDTLISELRKYDNQSEKDKEAHYGNGKGGYWDDYCLAMFLRGVCLRYIAYAEPNAQLDPADTVTVAKEEAEGQSKEAFKSVFEHGPKIQLDHHLVYYAHYEYGRLLACQGDAEAARHEFELILSGKTLEVGPSGRKGKYSLESALNVRTHAALDALDQQST